MEKVWIIRRFGRLVAVAETEDKANEICRLEERAGRTGHSIQGCPVVPADGQWIAAPE